MKKFIFLIFVFAALIFNVNKGFSQNITNGSFETGSTSGWTIDTSFPAMPGDTPTGITQSAIVEAGGVDGASCLKLSISGFVIDACGTAHGPSATSNVVTGVEIGDVINFNWKANDGGDDFDVFAYIIEVSTGNKAQLLYQRGDFQDWTLTSLTSPYQGDIQFQFVCGTQDATCGKVVGAVMYIDNVRILRPTATPATLFTGTGFNANWLPYGGAVGFYLDVASDINFTNILPGYNNLNIGLVTTYTITATPGQQYFYRVRAMGASSLLSGNSNVIGTSPVAPVATAATSVIITSFSANWNAVTDGTGYFLDVSSTSDFSSILTGYNNLSVGNVTTYSVTGVNSEATYYYRVRATNGWGSSVNSNVISLTTPVAPPVGLSYSPNPVNAVFGVTNVSSSPSITGGSAPTSYSIDGTLPAGLTLNTTTGVISGIATEASPETTYTITGTNSAGSATTTYTLAVNYEPTPTTQASDVVISQVDYYSFQVDWTDGNGAKTAVFVKQTNTGDAAPVNTITYVADVMFMVGSEIETSDWYCVYDGTENSVIVTDLEDNTEYRVMVVEYNGVTNGQQYLVSTATGNPANATTLDVPELTIAGDLTYGELNLSLPFSDLSTITDVNPTNLLSAKAEITENFVTTEDELSINGTLTGTDNGIAYEFVPATGIMTLTGSASQADYQTVLRKLIYTNTNLTPIKATREITLSVVLENAPSIEIIDIIYIVFDAVEPVVNTQDITIELGINGTVVIEGEDVDDESTDNYGIATYTVEPSSFDCDDLGENTVTLTVTDMLGNSSSSTAIVTVEDNINPVAIGQPVTISLNEAGTATTTTTAVNNNSTDNCSIEEMTLSQYIFDGSNIGTNNVTFTVIDQSGNSNSVTVVVTVIDEIDPVVVIIGGTYTLDEEGNVITLDPEDFDGGTTDNCDFVLSISPETIDCSNVGAPVTVTLTATDCAGNTTSETTTITIVDNARPILVCPEDMDIVAPNGYTVDGDEFDLVSTDDNCSIQSVINDFNDAATLDGRLINIGLYTITWTAIDPSANFRTCSFDVTILTTSISDLMSKNINIFPNPSFDIFNVVGENIQSVKVYDIAGKLIVEKSTTGNATQIDLTNSNIGVYFVELNLENEVLFTKIIKK